MASRQKVTLAYLTQGEPMLIRFKSCYKCGGDLALDGDEWYCMQCGQGYYPVPLSRGGEATLGPPGSPKAGEAIFRTDTPVR